ncbi:hypothetical protein CS0771_60970 [Catellatospora sp. IY07-71]|uniref:DUF2975 domain-containing protein n=1 Tax=Catellatospora sp. IY07-71 TaxID=2728827 RepID=UPI001BB2EEB6|nr:DUF2975 domain-containing protein [Catellatospora sp. IY07-71]BCJ76553.1 hypothetical protein CS0771_60970 [Catellatospora sp. IY07-71]
MSLRRPDWLAELQSVLLAAMVLTSAVIAFGLIAPAVDDTVTFTVPAVSVDGLTDVHGSLRPNAAVDPDGDVDVLVTGPSAYQRVLHVLTGLPSYAVGLVMLVLLWSTVRLARRTGPFEQPVVRRLTWLGFVVVAGGLLADAVQLSATFLASETLFDGYLSASYAMSWWWLLAGIGFLAVAELVKRGAAMRAELDAVV